MSYKETPVFGIETPEPGQLDDVPNDLYKVALQIEELLDGFPITDLQTGTSGDLIVVQGTGHAAYKAMSGDATLSSGGVLTIGGEKVTAGKIAAEAIEAAKIAANAVVSAKIADKAVLTAKLEDLAVTAAKLAKEAVETEKIKDGAVTAAKLAALAVETAKIKDEAVTTAKLANLSVTTAKLADGAVTSPKYKPTRGELVQSAEVKPGEYGAGADIPGCSFDITPDVASVLKVTAYFNFHLFESSYAEGRILLDGVQKGSSAHVPEIKGKASSMTRADIALAAGVKKTVKLNGKADGSAFSSIAEDFWKCRMFYELVAS